MDIEFVDFISSTLINVLFCLRLHLFRLRYIWQSKFAYAGLRYVGLDLG
jgi:hypothetical protein